MTGTTTCPLPSTKPVRLEHIPDPLQRPGRRHIQHRQITRRISLFSSLEDGI
jgi:hypothetical protein